MAFSTMKLGLLLAAVSQVGMACLASSNPQTAETTTLAPLVCPCTLGHDVTQFCPQFGAAGGQAVFTITTRSPTAPVTEPICTLTFSGCQNYRLFFNNMCQENGNLGNPNQQLGPLICNVCPCALPSHDVTPMCPQFGAAGGQAVFVVTTRSPTAPATEPICTLDFSGCQNYRLFFGGICQENGNLGNPATQHPLTCNGVNWVDAQGRVYLAIDCQTK